MKYLNLGCGTRCLDNWINIDFIKSKKGVIAHNLLKGIPFPSDYFDVVYCSHVLEHFTKAQGEFFLEECFRVLKNNGILRVVVPDLEQIVKSYINQLELARNEENEIKHENYSWSVLELFDQTVREFSGGQMKSLWTKDRIINESFIVERVGNEFVYFRTKFLEERRLNSALNFNSLKKIAKSIIEKIRYFFVQLTKEIKIFKIFNLGKFRLGGEVHKWMYDSYSLGYLLKSKNFTRINIVDAYSSEIPNWEFHQWLDVENGIIRKPDSLFMEAIK
jgi:predicted SAM-dependent methyltransferase